MDRWLGGFSEFFYAVLRFVAGAAIACHGAQKLFGVFGGREASGNLMVLAVPLLQFVCGTLVALGLVASWAAFVAAAFWIYVYVTAHAPASPWPIRNGGELALLYGTLFLFVASRGSGPFSLDRLMGRGGSSGRRR